MSAVDTPRYRDRVPNSPKTPTRPVRLDADDWEGLGEVSAAQGANRSSVIRDFVRWYLGRAGAELPERPVDRARDRGRSVQIAAQVWEQLPAGGDPHADRAALINDVLAWYLRRPGAELPRRPASDD